MNIMPSASSIKKTPSHRKRNIAIIIILALLSIGVAVVIYFMFFNSQAKTTSLNNKMESTAAQIAAIPNLDTKENIDKFNKLVDEFQAARKQQEKLINSQLSNLK